MSNNNIVLRFDEVSFDYSETKKILEAVSFTVRRGSKITIMGQNGAGKSSLLKLITAENKPKEGRIIIEDGLKVAIAKQVFTKAEKELTFREYIETAFKEVPYNLDKLIKEATEETGLTGYDLHRAIKTYSGGQQARILLSFALVQQPDILLLDEPTNNLDEEGIGVLTAFLMMTESTCLVISHDADFLNTFTDGVLYLNIYTKKVEQYSGDYYSVLSEIESRVEKEQKLNARMQKQIRDNKEKINFFANKGGKMRKLASKLREEVAEAEDNIVEVRQDDRTIRDFEIPVQEGLSGEFIHIPKLTVVENGSPVYKDVKLGLRKTDHIQFSGPNGIGKTTLLNALATKKLENMSMDEELKIGYYTQDFSNLDYQKSIRESLLQAMGEPDINQVTTANEHTMRSVAAGFLIDSNLINARIGDLSEGQKGLVAFAHIVLIKPGLLILDEPTNHINFRHIPIIAKALHDYQGAMILVSHVPDFVSQIRVDRDINLGDL